MLLLLKREAESWDVGDKWKHCYLGCEIAKACGNLENFVAAVGREIADAYRILRGRLTRSKEPPPKVEFADIVATRAGVPCATDPNGCDCCCRRTYEP
jgi:hypothetical protein